MVFQEKVSGVGISSGVGRDGGDLLVAHLVGLGCPKIGHRQISLYHYGAYDAGS